MSERINFSNLIREDMILLGVEGNTRDEVLENIAKVFVEKGIAKDTFYQGLLGRENEFPTGLPMGEYNIAVPHTYPEHYNEVAVAICVPKNPTKFFNMGDKEDELTVQVIVCLALKKMDDSIKMLPSLMEFFVDQENIKAVMNAKTPAEVLALFA